MDFKQIPSRLRVFNFFGSTERFEDNVTRALLSVITRSLSGSHVLRQLLELICDRLETSEVNGDVARDMRHRLKNLKNVDIATQQAFEAGAQSSESEFAVVVEIGPSCPLPEAGIPAVQPGLGGGRLDAAFVFRCDDDKVFVVAIESKLYVAESPEKLAKYAAHLNTDRHAIAHIRWSDVLEVFDGLPTLNRADPLVEDFIEYLESFYWLAGFRGFSEKHFCDTGKYGRIHQLKVLTESLVAGDPGESPYAMCRPLSEAGDFDLYTWDQFGLIGNVGLASWDNHSIHAKLVIGSFQYYGHSSQIDRQVQIQEYSGRERPIAVTFEGTRSLLKASPELVASEITKVVKEVPQLKGSIGFRCFFGRFQDLWINSSARTLADGAWAELDAGLRLAERSEPVTNKTMTAIRRYLEPFCEDIESRLRQVEALLNKMGESKRTPTHHGVLVLAAELDSQKLIAAGSSLERVRSIVRETLDPMTRLLRTLSQISLSKAR